MATEDSNFFYCYCVKYSECDLCALCHFLSDDNNLMDGLPSRKFLQLNYLNRDKLDKFTNKIFRFFERMDQFGKRSLDFFNKGYEWCLKDYSTATYNTMTLTEKIESDKEFVKHNPHLFDRDFLKRHPHY